MAAPLLASLYDRKPLGTAEAIRESIHERARAKRGQQGAATQAQLGYMNGLLTDCFVGGDSGTVARHQFLEYVTGLSSSKGMAGNLASAIIDWARDPDGPGPHPAAVGEAWIVLEGWAFEHGQGRLL